MTNRRRETDKGTAGETKDLQDQIGQLEIELDQSEANANRHLGLAARASVIGAVAILGAIAAALLG
jgi:hypothetical protein